MGLCKRQLLIPLIRNSKSLLSLTVVLIMLIILSNSEAQMMNGDALLITQSTSTDTLSEDIKGNINGEMFVLGIERNFLIVYI